MRPHLIVPLSLGIYAIFLPSQVAFVRFFLTIRKFVFV